MDSVPPNTDIKSRNSYANVIINLHMRIATTKEVNQSKEELTKKKKKKKIKKSRRPNYSSITGQPRVATPQSSGPIHNSNTE